ncbi:phytoene/squalene synthase family protein [Sphingorhabdus arenilitoris]|uniref:Phytoene/squalene synthase family protein n=1 Tax=Sphingorhabdus arenilitoris TaxID=1490041 RepID=A0ABV8RDQ9_9SPHN
MHSRTALVTYARQSIAKGSKSFAAASKLFDRTTRERVWLLYAWCRKCDDMADGQDHGGQMAAVDDPAARLSAIRDLTAKAMRGEQTGEAAFDCLSVVAAECGLTPAMADAVIEGFALDAADWRPRSENDLYQYCYHVAGAVGVMMAVVMGVDADDDATLNRACDLGLAFQLANIARDLEEDDAAARCYLPVEWIVEMDIPPGQHMKPHYRSRLTQMAKMLCDASEKYEASARVGATRLPFRARWAVLAAAGIYGDIARQVRSAGDHAWDHRIFVSKGAKAKRVAAAFVEAVRNKPEPVSRDGLWTRK